MLKKRFFKTKPTCQVTFQLPDYIQAEKASVVGDFNNWDAEATRMKKVKQVWKATVELEQGREYQFRYLVNGTEWHNDDAADKYVPNNIDGDNSVVSTIPA
ncbi:MAG: glycoside hydrolase [Chloroflexi bacterium]|nr:MAG: glycoside hydrolase [Chloroflexota bacterium]